MTEALSSSILIVGACQAGVQLASSLRERGHAGPITLVGAEHHLPYQRPPLSKALLTGDADVNTLVLRSADFYEQQQIALVLGDRVERLERTGDAGAGVATTATGRQIAFDRLALAVGSRARKLAIPEGDLDGIVYLRDADDALQLKKRLDAASNVVIVGGGFIGLEVAASARKLGKAVTVVLPNDRILARAVGREAAEFIAGEHRRRGVRILTRASVVQIHGDDRVEDVELASGEHVSADLVIVGIGADPRIELAEQFGLDVDNGIVVDEHALASDGWTVAAGDCANMPNPLVHGVGSARLRLESVNNATEQAKIAAASLVGDLTPYRTIPWFWSDQFDLKLQVAGVIADHDHVVVRGDVSTGRFTVFYYYAGSLIAAECVNNPVEFMAVRGALLRGNTIPPEAAVDLDANLKQSAVPAVTVQLQSA